MADYTGSIFKEPSVKEDENELLKAEVQKAEKDEEALSEMLVEDADLKETEGLSEIEEEAENRQLKAEKELAEESMQEEIAASDGDDGTLTGLIPASRRKQSRMYGSDRAVVTRGDSPEAETPQKKRHDTFIKLAASLRGGKILSGRISGVRTFESGREPCAMIMMDEWTVLIPAGRLIPKERLPKGLDLENPNPQLTNVIIQREESIVQFVVTGIDEEHMLAAGDRLSAMAQMRLAYFWRSSHRTGKPIINEGSVTEAAIQFVTPYGLGVEAFGYEAYLPASDVSYNRISVDEHFAVGDTVLVKFIRLERRNTPSGRALDIKMSVKEAYPNPKEKYFKNFEEGGIYGAKVTWTDKNGIFVLIAGKVEARAYFSGGEHMIPSVGDEVKVQITRKFEDTLFIYCNIIRILPRRKRGGF